MFMLESPLKLHPGVHKEEEAWRGGDADAAFRVVLLPNWDKYRDCLDEQFLRKYGSKVRAYATVTQDQFCTLTDGKDLTVGFYQTQQEARSNATKGDIVVAATIRPFMIFMAGKPGEIVCRTDYLCYLTMEVVGRMYPGESSRLLV